jgi:hypothetical protein
MTNGSIIEIENDVLRLRIKELTAAAKKLTEAVDAYTTKAGPRPLLINANENLKSLLK